MADCRRAARGTIAVARRASMMSDERRVADRRGRVDKKWSARVPLRCACGVDLSVMYRRFGGGRWSRSRELVCRAEKAPSRLNADRGRSEEPTGAGHTDARSLSHTTRSSRKRARTHAGDDTRVNSRERGERSSAPFVSESNPIGVRRRRLYEHCPSASFRLLVSSRRRSRQRRIEPLRRHQQ